MKTIAQVRKYLMDGNWFSLVEENDVGLAAELADYLKDADKYLKQYDAFKKSIVSMVNGELT